MIRRRFKEILNHRSMRRRFHKYPFVWTCVFFSPADQLGQVSGAFGVMPLSPVDAFAVESVGTS